MSAKWPATRYSRPWNADCTPHPAITHDEVSHRPAPLVPQCGTRHRACPDWVRPKERFDQESTLRKRIAPSLSASAVHMWAVPCDDPPASLEQLGSVLSPQERRRVNRLHFAADRRRAVVGRGVLRMLIAEYTGIPAASLAFATTAAGKPMLAANDGTTVEFNLSHSGRWILIGIARDREIGVDVECIRPVTALECLAERFFAPGEAMAIRALPDTLRTAAFFACWTRKEAFVKALGAGLEHPLDEFEVSWQPDGPARLLHVKGSADEASRWAMWSAVPQGGYVGAAVVRSPEVIVRSWYWTGSAGVIRWESSGPRSARNLVDDAEARASCSTDRSRARVSVR